MAFIWITLVNGSFKYKLAAPSKPCNRFHSQLLQSHILYIPESDGKETLYPRFNSAESDYVIFQSKNLHRLTWQLFWMILLTTGVGSWSPSQPDQPFHPHQGSAGLGVQHGALLALNSKGGWSISSELMLVNWYLATRGSSPLIIGLNGVQGVHSP